VEAVLEKHHVPYSHVKELLRGDSPFKRWDDLKKQEFVRDLYNALPVEDRSAFIASSLPIELGEYRRIADGKQT